MIGTRRKPTTNNVSPVVYRYKSQDPESNRDTLICSQLRSLSAILAPVIHNCDFDIPMWVQELFKG